MAINFGNEAEFLSSGSATYISVDALNETKFVVAYEDAVDSDNGTVKIGIIDGTDITFGTEQEFTSGGPSYNMNAVAALSESGFVVACRDTADSNKGNATVGTVSGTDITLGSKTSYANTASDSDVAMLSESGFVVVYADDNDSGHGTARIGTVSGTTITFGNESEFLSTGRADVNHVAVLSTSGLVVTCQDESDSSHGTAWIGAISGTDITFGGGYEFASDWGVGYHGVAALSPTKFVVAYQRLMEEINYGAVRIGEVSGTTITFGSEYEFISTTTPYVSVSSFSENQFVVVYRDPEDGGHGKTLIGTVDGTIVDFVEEEKYRSASCDHNDVATLNDDSKFVVVYEDKSDAGHGTAQVGTITGPTPLEASGSLFINGHSNSEFIFASSSTEVPVVRALADDKFVVSWVDADDTDKGKICIGTRSGMNITYGPTLTFASGLLSNSNYAYARRSHDIAVLDENNIFVTYVASTSYAYSLICTVSGEVLTSGASYIYTGLSNNIQCVACSAFTSDKVFWTVDYENAWNDQYIHARVASITGTTISLGTDDSVDMDHVDHIRATTIADDRVMTTWCRQRLSSLKRMRAMIYTRSGTTLTRGSHSDLYAATAGTWVPGENEPVLLSSGIVAELAVAYNWSYTGRIAYISVSGTAITVKDEGFWHSDTITIGALLAEDNETFHIVYRDVSDGNSGKIARSKIVDETLFYDNVTQWHNTTMSDHHATILGYPFIVVVYRDTSNSNYGTALIIKLPVDAQTSLYTAGFETVSGNCTLVKPGAHRHFASHWHPENWHLRRGHENG